MVKPLSEQFSDLSVRAKSAEDTVAAAKKDAHDKIVARREQVRVKAAAAVATANQGIKSVGDSVEKNWTALQTQIAADMQSLKAKVTERKHERDVKRADNRADKLEQEAAFAIDYAAATIEQAELAVLDAMIGRIEAEEARQP
jgi:hypothetical protein